MNLPLRPPLITACAVIILLSAGAAGVAASAELEPLSFLIGEWQATGSGQPGSGTGTATFSRELQGQVIVRRSFAEYPAAAGKPAARHDDLMIVYAQAGAVRADFYDSEGHVIRYTVRSAGTGQAVFVSDTVADQPRYRLTYTLDTGVLKGRFEIAPPGAPEAFKTYLTWDSTRSSR